MPSTSREARKRAAADSECSPPKKIKRDPELEGETKKFTLTIEAKPFAPYTIKHGLASRSPELMPIAEDEEVEGFPKRPAFRASKGCAGDYTIEESDEDEDEDKGSPRRSARTKKPAKGKCGGLSNPDDCEC